MAAMQTRPTAEAAMKAAKANDDRQSARTRPVDTDANLRSSSTSVIPVLEHLPPARSTSRVKVIPGGSKTGGLVSTEWIRLKSVALYIFPGAMALICVAWTVWLILLTIQPNETVNQVMKTENFDNGSFWLMVDPPVAMRWLSVCGLSLAMTAYGFDFLKMFTRRNRISQAPLSSWIDSLKTNLRENILRTAREQQGHSLMTLLSLAVSPFVKDDSLAVQITRVWVKLVDLAVETVLLYAILEAGSPSALVITFTGIIGMNALSCATIMFLPDGHSGMTEILVDTVFDFLVAVGYPILTVIYCLSSFKLDRFKININLDIFPVGWFEQDASVIADPVQTDIIHKSLKSLQIFSAMDFIVRVGINLMFAYRLYSVVLLIRDPGRRPARLYPKRHRLSTLVLVLYAVSLVVFVEESVRTSVLACQHHPECAVKAHRWISVEEGSMTQCPCLTLIDQDIAPKSFADWMQPVDVTDKVVQLATTGDLRTIKLVNRYFPVLPDELRGCRHLRHLSLIYTYTEHMPDWIKEFVELEYLYVEGSFTSSLVELPGDIFNDMKSLLFIHLGVHLRLQHLPSFEGLVSLKTLKLAMFGSLAELPAFDSLHNLERLVLTFLPLIPTIPDLKSLQRLKAFSVNDRGMWCCNGFLGGCNLQDPFCGPQPLWGIPVASCLPDTETRATAETVAVVTKFSDTVCRPEQTKYLASHLPTPERSEQCGGVLYRRCSIPGREEAMCYSERFMVISCDEGSLPIKMRRRQIQLGVGEPCNPEYEAWLGCK